MVQEFFRKQNEDEKRDFTDIGPNRRKDPKSVFLGELSRVRLEIGKKKLPFFKKAAMDDFDEHYKEEVKKSMRKNGYVNPADIKKYNIDWNKYSSTDNIELVEVQEVRDAQVSKKHPFDVTVKAFRYKYKGYGQEGAYNISVMEEEVFAVRRARANYENKPELEKESLAEKNSKLYDKRERSKEDKDKIEDEADGEVEPEELSDEPKAKEKPKLKKSKSKV